LKLMQQETPQERRTLSYFRHLVQDYDQAIANILDGFCCESRTVTEQQNLNAGFVAKIFDADTDPLQLRQSRLNIFEMGKLMEQGDRVVIPALRYLIHVVSKQFDTCEPTLLVFDESFLFFKHPLFRERIIEWIKTVRRFNVAIIFATQELTDLFRYEELRSALKINCATKIFLPNRKATTEDIYTQYRAMDLNDKQINLIAHGFKGEYFYFSELGNRKFTLDLAPEQATFAFVARTSGQDINKAIEIKAQAGNKFAYQWLKECGASIKVQQQWLQYDNEISINLHER
ncbi:MAG: hypothetical protein ACK4M7_06185, partial [Burkholderiales bacterium]